MARIIVVDDEPSIRTLVARILARAQHDVREAANGLEGVAAHRADPADLVITDLYMPEQDGIETIRQIREFSPDTRILAMSGGGAGGSTDALIDAGLFGADVVLQKPFTPQELERAVERLVG